MKRKIAVVTGTRAEYGVLYYLMKSIKEDSDFELLTIVTGMHLSPEFGLTYKVIEEDGFQIDYKVEILMSSDSPVGIAKSIGLGVIGFADAFQFLKPDMIMLMGDRFEALAAAQAAMVAHIPIIHLGGGDITEGAIDEAIRHSISKMSQIHFVTNEKALDRLKKMGEDPKNIFNVGSLGIEYIRKTKLLNREELERIIGFRFYDKNLLVTFHPATLEQQSPDEQFNEILKALDELGEETGVIFTKPNADTYGRILIKMIDEYVAGHKNARAYVSLGQLNYLSTVAQVDVVIGNSSSGIYEVPVFKKPTVNIGSRQKGRLQAASIINCEPQKDMIIKAIKSAYVLDCRSVESPYGMGESSFKIIRAIKEIKDVGSLIKKHFYEEGAI